MQMLREDQLTGKTLGEYNIERQLGYGQLNAVYLARHRTRGHAVMLTIFNYPDDSAAIQKYSPLFAREGQALVRLQHANILPTYDYGEQDGYPYLVTAYVKGASLAQALKQEGRFTLSQTQNVLNQLASGLDAAHSRGVTHGILSLSNVLLGSELVVQIAGFGLKTMLDALANTRGGRPQAHLFGPNGTFLGNPAYISPERVMGMPTDARADIYALGVMLFEMLSGVLPFQAATPLETALMRVQHPVPSLHSLSPEIPEAFDLLISKALERDPVRRYQHASEIASAFERVLNIIQAAERPTAAKTQQFAGGPQITLPPTVNWFDEQSPSTGKWQLMPPIITGHVPVVLPGPSAQPTIPAGTNSKPAQPVVPPNQFTTTSAKMPAVGQFDNPVDSLAGVDPFAWWTGTSIKAQSARTASAPLAAPGTFAPKSPLRLAKSPSRRRPTQQGRRNVVKLIATGGAVAGVIAVGGISFAHFAQSLKQSQALTNAPTTHAPAPTHGSGPQKTSTPSKKPTAHPSPTKAAQPSPTAHPTQQPTPKPTQQPPTPTPTQPPSHTGTVIGHTNMANNSSVMFNNPADGQGSLLIRLANGNFVACEQACTHEGVPVNYDAGQQQLVCPRHGAIFDPANRCTQVPGPGPSGLGPLPQVSFRVNADGTITTG